jgi:hypothetical protein
MPIKQKKVKIRILKNPVSENPIHGITYIKEQCFRASYAPHSLQPCRVCPHTPVKQHAPKDGRSGCSTRNTSHHREYMRNSRFIFVLSHCLEVSMHLLHCFCSHCPRWQKHTTPTTVNTYSQV